MPCRVWQCHPRGLANSTVTTKLWNLLSYVTYQTNPVTSHLGSAGRWWRSWQAMTEVPDSVKSLPADVRIFLCAHHQVLADIIASPSHSHLCFQCVLRFLFLLLVDFFSSSLPAWVQFIFNGISPLVLFSLLLLSAFFHNPPAINNPRHPTFCSHGEMNN